MKDQPKELLHFVNLADFKEFDFSIPEIYINFNIGNDQVNVISEYKFIKENPKSKSLKLKGEQINLIKIFLNNVELKKIDMIIKTTN